MRARLLARSPPDSLPPPLRFSARFSPHKKPPISFPSSSGGAPTPRFHPHALISPPHSLDPPPACVPPCALSSSGPIPPNIPSRPLPSAPPSWRGYYFILFYFLVLGWPPKSFQPGILLPPSLPLPALRPPGRWKQNLGSSGLEGRGGNFLPAASTGEK